MKSGKKVAIDMGVLRNNMCGGKNADIFIIWEVKGLKGEIELR